MSREGHTFNFSGGDSLTTIGASWFVSYMYYELIDKNHKEWEKLKTAKKSRIPSYNRTREYHKMWLEEVMNMNLNRLKSNTMKIPPEEIKRMAGELLSFINSKGDGK